MPALLRLHQAKALVNAPLEVAGGIALGALANLHHPFEVEQSLLNGAAEGGAVGDFFPKHFIIGIGMGVDVDEPHRTMFFGQRPQDRQGNGVVPAEGQRDQRITIQTGVVIFDNLHRFEQAVGIDRHIADVGHRQRVERRGAGCHIVRTDHHRFGANIAWSVARARALRGADIQRNADKRRVKSL